MLPLSVVDHEMEVYHVREIRSSGLQSVEGEGGGLRGYIYYFCLFYK